uniref:ribosomal protein S8 n=1 Tax=Cocconeiopsis kantsiensis TaxID=3082010 RepID=UPI0030013ED0
MKHYFYNMLSTLKNAQIVKRRFVYVKRKKNCEAILKLLWNEGFISGYKILTKDEKKIKVFLKYKENKPVINLIKLVSKPGRRVFFSTNQINKVNSNKSLIVVSTSQGLKSVQNCKLLKIGGEILIYVN